VTGKPPYRVPSMGEIRGLPWNGFNAVSTFSGCGGSSLGYRMAGFRVLWASEFIPAAQETYRANAAPYTVLDTRDIREVTGQDILDACGLGAGEIDLFDGSPPCASFSTAGKREAGWGQVKKYSDTQQRTDDLFYEYARLIEETQPRTFVAENVAGLVKGTAKGYFKLILARLRACGYRVQARVLDASWLGVPQARQRLIFVGVRENLGMDPVHPAPLPYRYTVRDALPWIAMYGTAPPHADFVAARRDVLSTMYPAESGSAPTLMASGPNKGAGYVCDAENPATHDPETGQALSIKGYAVGDEWARLRPGEKSQKYFHVRRQHPDRPYNTVMAAQGDVTITGPCHGVEARKLTLGELRAIGGFPADFVLTGTYAQRWERIGRAVPPVMMSHIATAVRDRILVPLREAGTI
jgi:DNA (cytosine-5)-methyltransferase 1